MAYFNFQFPLFFLFFALALSSSADAQRGMFSNWKTNLTKKAIDLDELRPGGPPKDGIPSIDNPRFVSIGQADSWLNDQEPVIALNYNGVSKAYPLQILIYHEIANDTVNGEPVAVTFCPLCYSALTFSRTVNGETLDFGVSGFLRHSDLVMYDRKTESLWQQFTGKAIVGDYTGTELKQIPSQIISWKQFKESYPDGSVLSKNTGFRRDYGSNPYPGYDNVNNTPWMISDLPDSEIPPMEKVIGVKLANSSKTKTYPYSKTKKEKVINDRLDGHSIVIFHIEGANSALDARKIAQSKESGSTGVFERTVDGQTLTFTFKNGEILDEETGSSWSITGKALDGPMKGKRLKTVTYGDYFAFAWLTFRPDSEIYR